MKLTCIPVYSRRRKKVSTNAHPTAAGSSSSGPPPPWIELPRDVTANILRRLSPAEILDSAQRVCSTWRSVCGEPSLWRVLDLKYSDVKLRRLDYADRVCRRAVDRSQGLLTNIRIEQFGTDDLLRYISDRCSGLKVLTLEFCQCMRGEGLATVVKSFPHLEELHLVLMSKIHPRDIETIGKSFPMLKSFTFNNLLLKFQDRVINNSYAVSIGKSMPSLVRLCLVGNRLDNEGLLAILDGCPNLELLDLRRCYGVDLQCGVGRRCLGQIRELRCPWDSTDDFKWVVAVCFNADGEWDYY